MGELSKNGAEWHVADVARGFFHEHPLAVRWLEPERWGDLGGPVLVGVAAHSHPSHPGPQDHRRHHEVKIRLITTLSAF